MKNRITALLIIVATLAIVSYSEAQTTAFTYQGNVTLSGQPANGNHDFEFRLFLSPGGADQIGNTLTVSAVPITAGHFTVDLDFEHSFSSDRYLEIRVRQTGTPTFITLSPRHRVTSTPTAVNSLLFGGLPSSFYARTNDPRFTDFRNPLEGSLYYVQNTTTPQAGTNFNISGTGTASVVNAVTQFNMNGSKLISVPTTGTANLFIGVLAGQNHSLGNNNTFFGREAGRNKVSASDNSFFGAFAGGLGESDFGNSFFGAYSGQSNTGPWNTFIGRNAGFENGTGAGNTFIGYNAGTENITGSENTSLGANAGPTSSGLVRATAIGAGSTVSTSNTIMLGTTADTVRAPNRLTVGPATQPRGDLNVYANTGNADLYIQADGTSTGINLAASSDPTPNFFISHYNGTTYTDRLIIHSSGTVRIPTLGAAGATALCRNASNDISTCSSSAKYKTNISSYRSKFNIVDRLRPVTFNWTDGNAPDLGLVAEEVAEIDPLLVTYNDKGEVEGVKYDRIGVVLINTVKEQQRQIDELKLVVCELKPEAKACKKEND